MWNNWEWESPRGSGMLIFATYTLTDFVNLEQYHANFIIKIFVIDDPAFSTFWVLIAVVFTADRQHSRKLCQLRTVHS